MSDATSRERKRSEEVITTDVILPNQTNGYGTIFGGEAMAMMDRVAAVAALRFCRKPVVTAATERLSFLYPINQREIIELRARVIYTGNTSIIVRVHVYSEQALSGERRLCTTGYFSMVAIDSTGKPQQVPELIVESEGERREWAHGEDIRREVQQRGL
jgi:acyl-CoA hydrolase